MKLLLALLLQSLAIAQAVRSYETDLTIPTYVHSAREAEPPLFAGSSVNGQYPFTTYLTPFTDGAPKPKSYHAVCVENEYLKLTYLPALGGRFFSLYDKRNRREVFYRNDVIKPTGYNPRHTWPVAGLELTGPHDLHMLTIDGEPFWAHRIVRRADGAISLVLGEFDPVYQTRVSFTATLHPGVAAMQISVFSFNPREMRTPQMFWTNAAIDATPKLRFLYPMTRTVGHTTSDIASWPVHNGVDYSWDRNNQNMLGVFGIDTYDNFQGAYQLERDYGIFRHADRRIVQGMKMWTFGNGPGAKVQQDGYTDAAGPYVEIQSGRHVWDGHYEWIHPHKTEAWSEWWIPVAGIGGLTTLTDDVALHLDGTSLALAATRIFRGANVAVRSGATELLKQRADLDPSKPFRVAIPTGEHISVTVTAANGRVLLEYRQPEGGKPTQEYTPFTRPLEEPRKSPDTMTAEELTIAAESAFKSLDTASALSLIAKALALDAGSSKAHLLLGIHHFTAGRHAVAAGHLEKAIARDNYSDDAHYHLAMARFALGDTTRAVRQLYYIWPGSGYYGPREYHLGRQALLANDAARAAGHLEAAVANGGGDLSARLALSVALRQLGQPAAARAQLNAVEALDPTNPIVQCERLFLNADAPAKQELARLMGGQAQEALNVSSFYRDLSRWKESVAVLRIVELENRDKWGIPPEFHYVVAHSLRRAGDTPAATAALARARASAANIDRFPYRIDSEPALAEAVQRDPADSVARYALGCLLYFRERPAEAIAQWEQSGAGFSVLRALGLAYAAAAKPLDQAVRPLEQAVTLNPSHRPTWNDLSSLYATAGRFADQRRILEKGLARWPSDDGLTESLLAAMLAAGQYDDAEKLLTTHPFAPRHRSYSLREKYRMLRIAQGARAYLQRDYALALRRFDAALQPPTTLGLDDFANQTSPRIAYLRGRALEALGRAAEAEKAYQQGVAGAGALSGDRDSWSSENFYLTLSLRRLGRAGEAAALLTRFENFALGEAGSSNTTHRAAANCLLGLIRKYSPNSAEARAFFLKSIEARPDWIESRLELAGDSLSNP